jgi:hypothetical protein
MVTPFMSTSQRMSLLSELAGDEPLSEATLLYLEQRAHGQFYDYVLKKFEDEQKRSGLTKASLARRIRKGSDQVNRWLASPGNWTIGTASRLLAGIAAQEALLTSAPLIGRPPANMSVMDLLDEDGPPKMRVTPLIDTYDPTPHFPIRLELRQ